MATRSLTSDREWLEAAHRRSLEPGNSIVKIAQAAGMAPKTLYEALQLHGFIPGRLAASMEQRRFISERNRRRQRIIDEHGEEALRLMRS